jgi:hypothetical protein
MATKPDDVRPIDMQFKPGALRDILLADNPEIADWHKLIWIGGTIYRWSDKEPVVAFAEGFTRNTGYNDIVRHVKEANAGGSNWLSCSLSREATSEYGRYCYEVVLDQPHKKAIDANHAVKTLTKHLNPHMHQQEISVFKHITPTELVAVWVPIANPVMRHDKRILSSLLFEERYEKITREQFLKRGLG